jgi:hypothetical protein
VFTQCINSLKIAIIIYRCIKKIQLVWCWPMQLRLICNSRIILKLDKPKQKKLRFIFMFCSDTSVTKMKMFFMKHTSYSFNITSENTIFIPTWLSFQYIAIFHINIFILVQNCIKFFNFNFYKSSPGVSDFLTNKAIL